jgi:ankyrin repeat protein
MKFVLSLVLLSQIVSLPLLSAMSSTRTDTIDSFSLLKKAIEENDFQAFTLQFDLEKDLSKLNERGETLLHVACSSKALPFIAALIEKGANYQALDSEGFTPLDRAICYGYSNVVQEYVQHGIPLQSAVAKARPIHIAAVRGDVEQLHVLQASGSNLTEEIEIEVTAFNIAVSANQVQFVQELLAMGTYDVTQRGQSLLDNYSPAEVAVASGYVDILRTFLAHQTDVHTSIDNGGDTLLHTAAKYNQAECVEILVQAGADMNVCNYSEQTPLMVAVEEGNYRCIETLIRMNPESVSRDDGTLLCRAVFRNHISCISLLLRLGIQPNWFNEEGKNALYYAIRRRNRRPTELSLQSRALGSFQEPTDDHLLKLSLLLQSWPSTRTSCCADDLTPFHLAMGQNEVGLLRRLIAHSHLLFDTPNLVDLRESRETLILNQLKLRAIYNSLMSQHSDTPNTRNLVTMTMVSEPFRNEILAVFLYEMRYGNLSKSRLLIAAKDFVIHHLALYAQAYVKNAQEEYLTYQAQRRQSVFFNKNTTSELNDEMKDFIEKVTTDYEYTRDLIKEVIDYYVNHPVSGTHQNV